MFVTRARSLVSLAPKGNIIRPGTDLSKMNPAMSGGVTGGMVGSGLGRGPRDRLIGVLVTVVKGPQKGYIGIIKDTNGPMARVELNTNNKVITIEKEKLYRRKWVCDFCSMSYISLSFSKDGKLEPLEGGRDMGPPRGGFGDGGFGGGFGGSGGRTPNPYTTSGGDGWGGGRTPNPYASGGKTPAWNSSKTPNAEGGRTPFTSSSQTPNPYAQDGGGGRTPGWGPSARTPNPYTASTANKSSTGSGWGGATPGWGGATPKPPASTWNESSPAPQSNNGWASPGPTSSGGGWGGGESSFVSVVHCVLHS